MSESERPGNCFHMLWAIFVYLMSWTIIGIVVEIDEGYVT